MSIGHGKSGAPAGHPASGVKCMPWQVLHACEFARDVLALIDGQLGLGMRPYVVTPQGAGEGHLWLTGKKESPRAATSLLRMWSDVRQWRKSLSDYDPGARADIVHAHSFASAMAAVRNCPVTVFDLRRCVDDLAVSHGQTQENSWLSRSFRVAEQFALGQSQAVVVHSSAMRKRAMERGANEKDLFLIPGAIQTDDEPAHPDRPWLRELTGGSPERLFLGAPRTPANEAAIGRLLEAFALVHAGLPETTLVIHSSLQAAKLVAGHARTLHLDHALAFVSGDEECERLLRSADVVIAQSAERLDQHFDASAVMLQAMLHARAVVAADIPTNRDVSESGRGCLWFEEREVRDLAHRASFLLRNPDMRTALARAARAHIVATRSPAVIAAQHDRAYRHAFNKKRSGITPSTAVALQPALQAGG